MGTARLLALDWLLTNHFRSRNRRPDSRIASVARAGFPGSVVTSLLGACPDEVVMARQWDLTNST